MTADDSVIVRAGVDVVDEGDYEGWRKLVDERDYEGRRRLRGREGLRGPAETTWTRGATRAGGDYVDVRDYEGRRRRRLRGREVLRGPAETTWSRRRICYFALRRGFYCVDEDITHWPEPRDY